MANFSLTTGRNEDVISQNVTGRIQATALYVIDTAANGNNWIRLTTATDLDTAETTAKAAALAAQAKDAGLAVGIYDRGRTRVYGFGRISDGYQHDPAHFCVFRFDPRGRDCNVDRKHYRDLGAGACGRAMASGSGYCGVWF